MKTLLLVYGLFLAMPGDQEHGSHSEKLGSVRFKTSCSQAAQPSFLRGVAWLHSFEYEQSESSFNQAAAADASCGIAHWGAAMSLYHPLWAPPSSVELERGRAAVAKAQAAQVRTQREKD